MNTESPILKTTSSKNLNIEENINSDSKKLLMFNNIENFYRNRVRLSTRKLSLIEERLKTEPNSSRIKPLKLTNLNNNCNNEKQCIYYKKYIKLKKEFDNFINSNNKLVLFNNSLFGALLQKIKDYKYLMNENSLLKKALFKINGITYNDLIKSKIIDTKTNSVTLRYKIKNMRNAKNELIFNNIKFNSQKITDRIPPEKMDNNNYFLTCHNFPLKRNINNNLNINNISSCSNDNNLYNKDINKKVKYFKVNITNKNNKTINNFKSMSSKNPLNNKIQLDLKNKKNLNYTINLNKNISNISAYKAKNEKNKLLEDSPSKHYEIIEKIFYEKERKNNVFTTKSSLIALNIDLSKVMSNNDSIITLEELTKEDEYFLKTMRNSSENQLLKYLDSISCLINDYKELMKLGMRMKDFMKSSIILVDSIISNNLSKVFIDNICQILKCDRSSLFLYDQMSDSLIVYSGEGLKKAQIKVPKDKGVVGSCFMECQKIRIDEAYTDQRFNKEVDKRTNYRTRSILCYPLIDNDGKCFGVIEAINKIDSPFDDDDEELLKLLSHQASTIFKNNFYKDDNKLYIKKLFLIIDFCNKISYIKDIKQLSEKTEEILLNLYNCMISAIFFVENGKIVKYLKDTNKKKEYDNNIGIVGKVFKSKELIAYESIKNSLEFNTIVDLETSLGILAFPILAKKSKNVCAIIEVPFSGKVNKGKPNEKEINIIKKLSKCIKNWIYRNDNESQ